MQMSFSHEYNYFAQALTYFCKKKRENGGLNYGLDVILFLIFMLYSLNNKKNDISTHTNIFNPLIVQTLIKAVIYDIDSKNSCEVIYLIKMPKKVTYCMHKKRYAQISVKKRLQMVKMVEVDGRSYSDAARRLHANPSTVRLIIKKYKETGTIFMKKLRNASKVEPQPLKVEASPVIVKVQATENDKQQEILLKQEQKVWDNVKIEPSIKKQDTIFPFYDQLLYPY